jgi:transcriptional regulator with XRE-family HTH domain
MSTQLMHFRSEMASSSIDPSLLRFDLGDRLRRSLRITDIGVAEIAEELGVSRVTVSKWLNGRAEPSRATMMAWSMATGVPLQWILTGEVPGNDENPWPGGPGGRSLRRLDSNQQPSDYRFMQVTEADLAGAEVFPFPGRRAPMAAPDVTEPAHEPAAA